MSEIDIDVRVYRLVKEGLGSFIEIETQWSLDDVHNRYTFLEISDDNNKRQEQLDSIQHQVNNRS